MCAFFLAAVRVRPCLFYSTAGACAIVYSASVTVTLEPCLVLQHGRRLCKREPFREAQPVVNDDDLHEAQLDAPYLLTTQHVIPAPVTNARQSPCMAILK